MTKRKIIRRIFEFRPSVLRGQNLYGKSLPLSNPYRGCTVEKCFFESSTVLATRSFSNSALRPYLEELLSKLEENKISDAVDIFVMQWKEHAIIQDKTIIDSDMRNILKHIKNSPHQAEEFLKALQKGGFNPTLEHYMVVLEGWLEHFPPSAKRAQKLLDYMAEQGGVDYAVPSCNLVLQAWAKLNNAEGAEKLFEKMLAKKLPVDADSFAHVLNAWSKSKSALAPKKADALLSKMTPLGVDPTIDCYLWIISSWSKTNRKGSEDRLEVLYREISSIFKEQDCESSKIQQVILSMLQAYGRLNNAHRSEEILLSFADEYRRNKAVPPTLEMCLTVLSTWSRSKSSRRGARAEKLLSFMEKDDALPKPNVACYTAVINCLASSNKPNAAQRAELVFRLMETNPGTQPNLMTYTCLLNAWARSKAKNAPLQVERLYQEMKDHGIEPDRRVFAVLISAWGRSSNEESVANAEKYLKELKELSIATGSDPAYTPTVVEYTATMQAWANYVPRNLHQSREAVARVQELLDEMMASDDNSTRPNSLTYAAVLKTIAGALRIPDRRERAMNILSIMDSQKAEVTPYIKSFVQKCRSHE